MLTDGERVVKSIGVERDPETDQGSMDTTEGRHCERSVAIQTQTAKQFSIFSVASQQVWITTSPTAPRDDVFGCIRRIPLLNLLLNLKNRYAT